ncbi:recombinase family protein [Myxococcota bacterium]|nr:recombinase family protein [Myxococcota bacterium]
MNSPRLLRAALYARVSTVNHGQDVGLQIDELRQVAQQRGWAAVEYVGAGVSGTLAERPGLSRMLADAHAGKLDVVAVWRLDRLGRSLQHVLATLEQLNSQGIAFVSLRDVGLDSTTPAGRLFTAMIAAFAAFERDLIQERVIAGVRRAQAAGKHCGRPRRDLDLRPAVALLKEGRGLKDVARILAIPRATLRRRLQEAGHWPVGDPGSADEAA